MISVIMSVHNTKEEYLRPAIESILNQTYSNFEFIIIDDNSDSRTKNILKSYQDERIIIHTNSQNLGLTKSLNIGINLSRGKYIARMDSDDISLKTRLEEQLKYMEEHPDVVLLGSFTRPINTKKVNRQHWTDNQDILKIRLLFYNIGIAHPTAFFRRDFLLNNNIKYDETYPKSQDYAMWVNVIKYGKIAVLPKALLEYRIHSDQITSQKRSEQIDCENRIILRQFEEYGFQLNDRERSIISSIYRGETDASNDEIKRLFKKMVSVNYQKRIFDKELFKRELIRVWIVSGIKQYKKAGNSRMLLSSMTLKLLCPSYFFHVLSFFIFEDSRFRAAINKFKRK